MADYEPNGTLTTPRVPLGDSSEEITSEQFQNAVDQTDIDLVNGRVRLAPPIPQEITNWWQFEDDSDTSTAVDSEGSYDGSINGASYTTTSAVGDLAMDFSGGDYTVDNLRKITDTFTMAGWLYLTSKPSSGNSFTLYGSDYDGDTHGVLVEYDNADETSSEQLILKNHDGADNDAIGSGTALTTGEYHHFGVTLDWDTADVAWWVNNSEENTGKLSNSPSAATASNTRMGGYLASSGELSQLLSGYLDDVALMHGYYAASEDIDQLYQRGV